MIDTIKEMNKGMATVWIVFLTSLISIVAGAGWYYIYQRYPDSAQITPPTSTPPASTTTLNTQTTYKSLLSIGGDRFFDAEIPRDWSVFLWLDTNVPRFATGPSAVQLAGTSGRMGAFIVDYIEGEAESTSKQRCVSSEFSKITCSQRILDGQTAYIGEETLLADSLGGRKGDIDIIFFVDSPTVNNMYFEGNLLKKSSIYPGQSDYSAEIDHFFNTFKFNRSR